MFCGCGWMKSKGLRCWHHALWGLYKHCGHVKPTVRCNFLFCSHEASCQDAWIGAAAVGICSHADNLWACVWSALRPRWWSKFLAAGGGARRRAAAPPPRVPPAFKLLTSCCIYVLHPFGFSSARLTFEEARQAGERTCGEVRKRKIKKFVSLFEGLDPGGAHFPKHQGGRRMIKHFPQPKKSIL